MVLAYDGSGFRGFAAQEGQPTVAGALTEALGRVTRSSVAVTCAGRTDAGVHALDQVVHFDVPARLSATLDPRSLVKSCNSQLGPAIVVREAAPAPEGFDARHSATARRYRYLVVNAPAPDPLLARPGLARVGPARPPFDGRRRRRPARRARLPGLLPADPRNRARLSRSTGGCSTPAGPG